MNRYVFSKLAGAALLGLIGGVLFVPNALRIVSLAGPPSALALAALGGVISLVAAGALDGAITNVTANPWDSVAGIHLVEAAGGRVTDLAGDRWAGGAAGLVASNGQRHGDVLAAAQSIGE